MAPTLPATQTQLVLLRRPVGAIDPSLSGQGTFGKKTVDVTKPASLKPDEVILAVEWLSLDPAMRGEWSILGTGCVVGRRCDACGKGALAQAVRIGGGSKRDTATGTHELLPIVLVQAG